MVGVQKCPFKLILKVGPENIQTSQNQEEYWIRRILAGTTRRMGNLQHVQQKPADMIQRATIQNKTYKSSTTTMEKV